MDPSISATIPPTQSARYLRILLVESNPSDALAFRHVFERREVSGDIVVYSEAEQALEHLQSTASSYDLLVTNYELPGGMSGLDLWQAVLDRKLPLPVVMITDIGTEHLAVEALKAGVADYLIKDLRQGYLHLLPIVLPQVVHKYRRNRTQQQVHSIIGEAFERVERAKQEWEATVDTLPQFVCLLDHQERILRANRILETWQVAKVKEVKGQKIHDLFHPNCLDPTCYMTVTWSRAWQKVSQGETIEFEAEDKILSRYLLVQIRPISGQGQWESKSQNSFAIVVFEDITARKEAEEALMKSLQETKMAYEQAKVYAHDLTDEIKERRRAEVTLREYTAELELRNQELDEFARSVAHDLKNPLGPIIGYSEMIVENHPTMSGSQLETFLQVILHNSHRMKNIVDTLYLLATVRNAEVELLSLDMAQIISHVQERLHLLIETQQPEISIPDQWPTALGCAPWVEEIWVNYLSNALKYSGQAPRIELGATPQAEGLIRFWVRDYGPGLELQAQANLFAAPPQLNQVPLTGEDKLGLSIVGYIAEKLGGQAGVESSGQAGQGCLFYFTLPAAPQ